MKLLVIVLCLLSERYLTHKIGLSRFCWFNVYRDKLLGLLPKNNIFQNPWLQMGLVILPVLLLTGILLLAFKSVVYGLFIFIIQLFVFYYCLGPSNSFYPLSIPSKKETQHDDESVKHYLASVNNQLFGVMFWYVTLGPLALIIYRMVNLCQTGKPTSDEAKMLTGYLDWIPARLAVIFYLIVGNFQKGFQYLLKHFFWAPSHNAKLLTEGAYLALRTNPDEVIDLPQAEGLIEHAAIAYLVVIAIFTLVAW